MTRVFAPLTALAAVGAALAAFSGPAAAQSTGGARIVEIIVYGDDPCPRSTESEVVVCARKPEAERYRIPERYREGGSIQSRQSWAARARSFEYVGRTGTMSCSAVGPGGHTGCLQQVIERAESEYRDEVVEGTPPPE